jgi:hypothetical protein
LKEHLMVHPVTLGPRTRSPRSARAILTAPLFGVLLIPTPLKAQTAEFGFTLVPGAEVRWEQIELELVMVDGDTMTFVRSRQVMHDRLISVEPDGRVGLRRTSESLHFEMLGPDGVRQSYDSESGQEPVGPLAASRARQVGVPQEWVLDPAGAEPPPQIGPPLQAFPEGPVEVGDRWRWRRDWPEGSRLASTEVEYTLAGFDAVDGRRVAILEGTMSSELRLPDAFMAGMPPMPPFSVRAVYDLERRLVLEYVQEGELEMEQGGQVARALNRTTSRLLP